MKKIMKLLLLGVAMMFCHNGIAQTAAVNNKVQETVTFRDPPSGPIYGIFEGRSPCAEISRQFNNAMPADCDHLKWQIIFYHDSVTHQPTTFRMLPELVEHKPVTGQWKISPGTPGDPNAVVYVLQYGKEGKSFYLLKGDENVIFILDENKQFRTGNADFGFTLDRVVKVRRERYP